MALTNKFEFIHLLKPSSYPTAQRRVHPISSVASILSDPHNEQFNIAVIREYLALQKGQPSSFDEGYALYNNNKHLCSYSLFFAQHPWAASIAILTRLPSVTRWKRNGGSYQVVFSSHRQQTLKYKDFNGGFVSVKIPRKLQLCYKYGEKIFPMHQGKYCIDISYKKAAQCISSGVMAGLIASGFVYDPPTAIKAGVDRQRKKAQLEVYKEKSGQRSLLGMEKILHPSYT